MATDINWRQFKALLVPTLATYALTRGTKADMVVVQHDLLNHLRTGSRCKQGPIPLIAEVKVYFDSSFKYDLKKPDSYLRVGEMAKYIVGASDYWDAYEIVTRDGKWHLIPVEEK